MNIQKNRLGKFSSSLPLVSIVIPCRNEATFIQTCLSSIFAQDYPSDKLEVLIIDGMSDDGTKEIINSMIMGEKDKHFKEGLRGENGPNLTSRNPIKMAIIDNPARTVPTALNIGFKYAKGEVIFRLDGHSELAPNYIRACIEKLLENPKVGCVGGPSVATGSGFIGIAYSLALQSPFGVGGGTFRTARSEQRVDTLAFGGYPKKIFEECGPFDPDLARNQDIAFNAEVRKRGYSLLLIPNTFSRYHGPNTFCRIVQQNFWNGYWNTSMLHKMFGVLSWRHFIPFAFFVSLVFAFFFSLITDWGWVLFPLLGGIYLVCSIFMTVMEIFKHKRKEAIFLVFIFPAMHLSYGFGSCIGLLRFFLKTWLKSFSSKRPGKLFHRFKMFFKPIT